MRIVVTGAMGFIGRNFVQALNDKGYTDIILVDELGTDERWKYLLGLRFEDFINHKEFRSRVKSGKVPNINAIVHLGACSATTETDADYLMDNNYRFSRELCEFSLANNARFVYASSAATYGDGALGYSDVDTMTPKYRPLNMYGYSKHVFDLWALKNRLFDRIAGLKYFNVYGPWEDHKGDMRSLVNKAYHQINDTGKIQLFKSYKEKYADGEQMRDFVYVKDAVNVTMHFMEYAKFSGLFNVGSGKARTWVDLANAIFAAMGKEPNIEFIDMPETLKDKYQYYTKADHQKLYGAAYTKDFTSVEDGVKHYVDSYLNNPPV